MMLLKAGMPAVTLIVPADLCLVKCQGCGKRW